MRDGLHDHRDHGALLTSILEATPHPSGTPAPFCCQPVGRSVFCAGPGNG
jgi:hypothetical protein